MEPMSSHFNISPYATLKGKKTPTGEEFMKMQRLAPNVFQIIAKRFSDSTAEEISPVVIQLSIENVEQTLASAQTQLAALQDSILSIKTLLEDMKSLEAASPKKGNGT